MRDARSTPGYSVAFEHVVLSYGRERIVDDITGTVANGELLALVGPNGAGKSTLMKAIAGLHKPASGRIDHTGQAARLSYMPQISEIDRSFPIGVLEFVAMGLWYEIGSWRAVTSARRSKAINTLREVGLYDHRSHPIGSLSGGQMRRALFARTMMQDARLVLLDEPFAGVDAATTADLIAVVQRWHIEGRTVIVALHDLAAVRRFFPQVLLLARRVIAWGEPASVLTEDNLIRARTMGEEPAQLSDRKAVAG